MTRTQAYARLVEVDRQLDRLTRSWRDAIANVGTRHHDALMAEWAHLQDVLDPERKIDYRGDITVFAPAGQAHDDRQLEMFS